MRRLAGAPVVAMICLALFAACGGGGGGTSDTTASSGGGDSGGGNDPVCGNPFGCGGGA